jgi:hypothetical protein
MTLLLLSQIATGYGLKVNDPYAIEPGAVDVTECGRCHPGQFGSLRDTG